MELALVDYGTGNLHTLARALQAGGATVRIEADLARASRSEAIVLPGVGAFGAAAARLAAGANALREAIALGTPCLGISLGMQLLFQGSDEGDGVGLGVLQGHSRRLVAKHVPHTGWNDVELVNRDPLFGSGGFLAYYANSYVTQPTDPKDVIAWTTYDGNRFPAAVRRESVWGVQFHPEKSGPAGLRLISDFVAQAARR